MEIEYLRSYLLSKKGAVEEYPFGPGVMVFKVIGKMFALVFGKETPLKINLKCDPDMAMHWRGAFEAVAPGYHMNKKHWNTVTLDSSIPEDLILGMIDDSYDLVTKKLKPTVA